VEVLPWIPCNNARVIQSFEDAATEDIFNGRDTKPARTVEKAVWPVVRRKLDMVNAAAKLDDLRVPPGNRLEALRSNQKGRHSIRVNDRLRITFHFEDGNTLDVCCEDYH
jgi:toxin HigB-1